MKLLKNIIPGLALVIPFLMLASPANAYILKRATAGKVTIGVTGEACTIPKTTVNAYLADIYTDEDILIGYGIVTTTGKLVALEESRSELRYTKVLATGVQSSLYTVDVAGSTLNTFLKASGANCDIDTLQPMLSSTANYRWSESGGKINYNAKFGGHVKKVCYSNVAKEYCLAGQYRGKVQFKGGWSSI